MSSGSYFPQFSNPPGDMQLIGGGGPSTAEETVTVGESGNSYATMPTRAQFVNDNLMRISGRDYGVKLGTGATQEAELASQAGADFVQPAVSGAITGVNFQIRFMANTLYLMATRIWVIGPALKQILRPARDAIIGATNTHKAQAQLRTEKAMPAFIWLARWALGQMNALRGNVIDAQIERYVLPVHREVDALWRWVSHVSDSVVWIEHHMGGSITTSPATTVPLHAQVADLQTNVQTLNVQVATQAAQLAVVQAQVAAIVSAYETLVQHQIGVRAINWSVADIEAEVVQLGAKVDRIATALEPQVAANTNAIAALAPLTVLLALGAKGIANLVAIENKLCHCPTLPHLPHLLPDALAAYEFLTNG